MATKAGLVFVAILVVVGVVCAVRWGCSSGEVQISLQRGGTASGSEIATPLTGSVQIAQRRRTVTFSLSLRDANGKLVRSVRLPNGKRPAAPHVEVLDAEGKRIYRGTMRYG